MVSGRYRFDDMAFSWTHVMPLTAEGISSNNGGAASKRLPNGKRPANVEAPAKPRSDRNSRRDGMSTPVGRVMNAYILSGVDTRVARSAGMGIDAVVSFR